MANPEQQSKEQTRQTTANYSQKDWEKVGMNEQEYKKMMSDNSPTNIMD